MKNSFGTVLGFMLSIIVFLAVFHSLYKLVFIMLLYFCCLYGVCLLFKKAFPLRLGFTVCIAASVIMFYFFTAVTSIGNEPLLCERCIPGDQYCNLAVSLINGKMGVIDVPEGTIHKDAWWDLSFYANKFYMYWGITPALTLFVPVKMLTGYTLHQSLCLALFISIGYIFSLFILGVLIEKSHLQPIPDVYWYLCAVCLGLCTFFPFILRSPLVYQIAIASGFCYSMGSLSLLLKAYYCANNKHRKNTFLFLSGLFCALAVGCRSNLIIITLFALLYFVYRLKTAKCDFRSTIAGAAAYCIPYVSYGAFLGIYNYIRFNSFFDFGFRYQLNHYKMQEMGFNFSNIVAGATSFLFTLPVYTASFPYFSLTKKNIFDLAHTYVDEFVVGVFWGIPIIFLLILLPVFLRYKANCRFVRLFVILMTCIAISLMLIVSNVGRIVRYECEFAIYLLIPALLVFFDLRNRLDGIKQHIFSVIACALIIYSITFNVCISFTGYGNSFLKSRPQLYNLVQGLF